METLLSRSFAQLAPKGSKASLWACSSSQFAQKPHPQSSLPTRTFSSTAPNQIKPKQDFETRPLENSAHSQPASDVSQNITKEEKNHFDRIEEESKEKQIRSPWMRQGSDASPVMRQRSAGAMTKGKLLTTPSRMLKLILPLSTRDRNHDRKDIEPLALLVHPQQPLSYLERLIQSELPMLEDTDKERAPKVTFRAQFSNEEKVGSDGKAIEEEEATRRAKEPEIPNAEQTVVDGKVEKTRKIQTKEDAANVPVHGHADRTHPARKQDDPDDPDEPSFVRWSPSTEIGDFIRDAARGKEFAVEIEGAPPIYVGVPSFNDRTYYLRVRLRKTAKRILQQADIKRECDDLAHRGAQRVAQGGFAAMIGWFFLVAHLTFNTSLGWDVMEPVTYLVGLSTVISGYMWFIWHNREVSYRAAMNVTVSRRQAQLYQQKGFDLHHWDGLVEEGNRLRREIKLVADEYDVEWDEGKDAGNEKVSEALREERKKKKNGDKDGDKKDDD